MKEQVKDIMRQLHDMGATADTLKRTFDIVVKQTNSATAKGIAKVLGAAFDSTVDHEALEVEMREAIKNGKDQYSVPVFKLLDDKGLMLEVYEPDEDALAHLLRIVDKETHRAVVELMVDIQLSVAPGPNKDEFGLNFRGGYGELNIYK